MSGRRGRGAHHRGRYLSRALALLGFIASAGAVDAQGVAPRAAISGAQGADTVPAPSIDGLLIVNADSTILARRVTCRPGFTPFALKQDWPWSVRAAALCIMPLPDRLWPWPPGATSGIVIMPRTPFTSHESSAASWFVVNGLLRSQLDSARVLVGRTPFPKAKYLAVEGPYP
jgi:hypothetical protein